MLCPIKVNSNTIELTVCTTCNCVLDLLCVNQAKSIVFSFGVKPTNVSIPLVDDNFGLTI